MGAHAWHVIGWALVGAWLYLLVAHHGFWRTDVRLPPAPDPERWPRVAVVVPARDEEAMIAATLPALADQDYPGQADVLVVDDGSSDGTAAAARAAGGVRRLPVTVVAGTPRPDGWAGKLWAVAQGVARARELPGGPPEWVLLTDADIAHPPDSLRRLVSVAEATRRDAVSLMARLRVATGWERLVIPAFVYFFAQLYPFRRVARPGGTAAAAGGCFLIRLAALDTAGGVESVRGALIDDVALARRLKRSGAAVWLGLADEVSSRRPYPHLADLWHMVARSAFTQLRYSSVLLAGTVAGLAVLYLGPLAVLVGGLATGDRSLAAAGAVAWAVMTLTYLPVVRYHRLAGAWALTLPAAAALYAAMTVDSARRHWQGRGAEWKGRLYRR